jgi:hypothetical protein
MPPKTAPAGSTQKPSMLAGLYKRWFGTREAKKITYTLLQNIVIFGGLVVTFKYFGPGATVSHIVHKAMKHGNFEGTEDFDEATTPEVRTALRNLEELPEDPNELEEDDFDQDY